MKLGVPKREKLINLLESIHCGKIRLPEFQRDFRWDPNNICELIGSLLSGYPAGVLLFWNISNIREKEEVSYRVVEGVDESKAKPVEQLILDGQQRLTSLYQLFYKEYVKIKGGRSRKFFINLEELKKGNFYECVEFYSERSVKKKKLDEWENQFRLGLLPFNIILKGSEFRRWIRGYAKFKASQNDENWEEIEEEFNRSFLDREKPLDNLINYEFHVIELPSNLSFEAVAVIFEKLNTTGEPLNIFEILTAKFFKNINLREKWRKAREDHSLLDKFSKDEKDTTLAILILKAILLQKSLDTGNQALECKRKNLLNDLSTEDVEKYWDKIAKIMQNALTELKSCGCYSLKFLPYTTILVPFALALNYIEEKLPPEKKLSAKKKLMSWYWVSVFSERYDSATDTKSKSDLYELIRWFENDSQVPTAVKGFSIEDLKDLKEVTRGAIYKGILNILVMRGCEDFADGSKIADLLEGRPEEVDVHHIFPLDCLRTIYGKGSEEFKYRDSILNKTLLKKDTNRKYIRGFCPMKYIPELEKIRNDVEDMLKKHLIPIQELKENNFIEFLTKREKLIREEISKVIRWK